MHNLGHYRALRDSCLFVCFLKKNGQHNNFKIIKSSDENGITGKRRKFKGKACLSNLLEFFEKVNGSS